MTDDLINRSLPGALIVVGAIINAIANKLRNKELIKRVEALEQQHHDETLVERIMQQLRAPGRS